MHLATLIRNHYR